MNQYPELHKTIDVNQIEDGYIIYQHDIDRVHYLNHTAAVVLELCSGKNAIDKMASIVQEVFGLPEPPEQEVNECLNSLFKEGIIK